MLLRRPAFRREPQPGWSAFLLGAPRLLPLCMASLPRTHRAGHGAAWQASRRLPGLLARSQSSSRTGVLRAGSMHTKRSSARPAGRKEEPRAPRRGSARTMGAPISGQL